jgi:hypothetical protein
MLGCVLAEMDTASTYHLNRFGITDIPACGLNDEVLKEHELDAKSLGESIHRLMSENKAT